MRRLLLRLPISKSLLRYLIVGGSSFVVEYGTFYLFFSCLHWRLYIANSISFILGLLTSFSLNRLWTFGSREKQYRKKAAHQFSYYAILAAANFALTNLIVELLSDIPINPRFGKLIAMVVTSLWNYFLFKFIIFDHHKTDILTEK